MSRSKIKGQGHRGQKTKKCGILFGSRILWRSPRAAFFSGAVLWDAVLYAGGKISACCLVFVRKLATTSGSLQLCPEIIYTILIVSEILF